MVEESAGAASSGIGKMFPKGKKQTQVWIIGGGVAFLAALYVMKRRNVTEVNPEANPDLDYESTDDGYSEIPAGSGVSKGAGSSYEAPVASNADWTQKAISYLSGLGYESMTVANALGKYIAGNGLTSEQYQIVQAAVAAIGYTPQSVPAPHISPPSGQTNPPIAQPAQWQGHRLTADTTWITLATRWSASQTPNGIESTKRALMLHNPTITTRIGGANTAVLKAGWIIAVPTRAGIPA